jgi:anti-sigma B factor antagonist
MPQWQSGVESIMDVSTDILEVAVQGADAFVRVAGRGSFKASPALKKFAQAVAEKGCRRITLDMKDCLGMDSTFMGVLAGIALMLRKHNGALILAHLSSKNCLLVDTLGLDRLVTKADAPAASAAADLTRIETGADKRTTAETMLEAHENLVAVAPENLPRFKDVLAYLREDLKRGSSSETGKDSG